MPQKTIAQGAEAVIFLNSKGNIVKDRIKKGYRISEIDEKIRTRRTKSEAKILEKAGKIIRVPKMLKVNESQKEVIIEFIQGKKLSQYLDSFKPLQQKQIMEEIGISTAKLHNEGIIHGDLTTSNMIYAEKEKKVYFIDFGLAFISSRYEDMAVDIHLLKQALEAKHFKNWQTLFKEFEKGYSKESKHEKEIFERLKKVESRGRYKH